MHRKAVALLSTLVLFSQSGCSLAFMTRAPDPVLAPNYPLECTSSSAAPVLDAICAGYFTANALVLASRPDCSDALGGESCYESRNGALVLDAALIGLCLMSSVKGFGRAQHCQTVKQQNALCITGNTDACRVLSPGWRPATPVPASALPSPAPAPAAVPAPPAQREDGLLSGAACTASWQCKTGLVCAAGFCLVP